MHNDFQLADDIVLRRADMLERDMSTDERQRSRRYVMDLLSRAKRNNWAWRKLELYFGQDGDVDRGDYDEPERRAD